MSNIKKSIKPIFQISAILTSVFVFACSVGDKELQNNRPITEQLGEAAAKTNEGILTDRQALAEFANMAGISKDALDNEWSADRTSLPVDGYILRFGAVNATAYVKLGAVACGEALIRNNSDARQKLAPGINFGQSATQNLPDQARKEQVLQAMATAMQGGRQANEYVLGKLVEIVNIAMTETNNVAEVLAPACMAILARGQNTIR